MRENRINIPNLIHLHSFILEHGATPDMVAVARSIATQNIVAVDMLINMGLVTEGSMDEIRLDDAYKIRFRNIADELYENGQMEIKSQKFIHSRPDVYGAWLAFYTLYLEETLDLQLIPKNNIDIDIEEFMYGMGK